MLSVAFLVRAPEAEGRGPVEPPVVRGAAPTDRRPGDSPEQRVVDRWLHGGKLEVRERVGISVVELPTGRLVAGHADRERFHPASVTKLFTTAAALLLLSPDTTWITTVHGDLRDGAVTGPLTIVGGGDPKLLPHDVDRLANTLVERGLREVREGVLVQAALFDGAVVPPAFDRKPTDAGYRASVGAAGSNYGAVEVTIRPGARSGLPVRVTVDPPSGAVVVENAATTDIRRRHHGVTLGTEALPDGRTRILVSGTLGLAAPPIVERKRVADPDLLTGHLLAEGLVRRGVIVHGPVRVARDGTLSSPSSELARHEGGDLRSIVGDINTWSNNYMAETILKGLAADPGRATRTLPATWERAVTRATAAIASLGIEETDFSLVNGSGLYLATEATPRAVTHLLERMASDPSRGDVFESSLAVAGRTGTLRSRLTSKETSGRVRAKTGTLDEVVALAGYVTTRSGRELAFAVFVNGTRPERTPAIRAHVDGLVTALARL
jgi:D-alanyl-D-alanine carboxypeptidase/D-alanyl-D-alanine-endopeptidase (penicillin-binding protein 4)